MLPILLCMQVVDTGLDYTSCYFVDADGEEVAHGHYYEEVGFSSSFSYGTSTSSRVAVAFNGGDFHADMDRRKVSCVSQQMASSHSVSRSAEVKMGVVANQREDASELSS